MKFDIRKILWSGLGWSSLILGIVGIVLPLLPTTPFILLSLYAFSKGNPTMGQWILNHPRLGPPVERWREKRCISLRVQRYALVTLVISFSITLCFSWGSPVLFVLLLMLGLVLMVMVMRLPVEVEVPRAVRGQKLVFKGDQKV